MKWRKKVLLAKSEASYGTDSTPAIATDAILESGQSPLDRGLADTEGFCR